MGDEWRNYPATQKQKDKLVFFGCTFDNGITKGEASDAITKCIEMFPEKEKDYQSRPATKAQMKKVMAYLKHNGEEIADYAENGVSLTYEEAKEIVQDYDIQLAEDREKAELEAYEKEYRIDEAFYDDYPGLTAKRVQAAADALDIERPGWRNEEDAIDFMFAKVAQQNPKVAERWRKKEERTSRGGRRQRKAAGNPLGVIIFLAIVIWIVWKMVSK